MAAKKHENKAGSSGVRGGAADRYAKQEWKPGNVLAPVPAVLVSCGGANGATANLITIAWAGTVCSEPPLLSISVRPERHSYRLIEESGEFVVNVPPRALARETDWCGMVSGRDTDKFAACGLTPAPALKVGCPIVAECPINLECAVRQRLHLGTHTMFVAEVVATQVTASLLDAKGKFRTEKCGLLALALGQYFSLGKFVGGFGFSVRKRKRAKRGKK